eukprot:gnl/Spiro4/10416_TR5568_c0_g1_i1.p1 gnl/Spiro4/10416_TR5568_c0_g1~~gnl/Spiro4/10416_TR5568_c0_g1_i1.p1  ORF type:complete len:440 (-),score=134.35 gnl/Spiro4/10416_TR5568_c0_g1_i1:134-1414(-)
MAQITTLHEIMRTRALAQKDIPVLEGVAGEGEGRARLPIVVDEARGPVDVRPAQMYPPNEKFEDIDSTPTSSLLAFQNFVGKRKIPEPVDIDTVHYALRNARVDPGCVVAAQNTDGEKVLSTELPSQRYARISRELAQLRDDLTLAASLEGDARYPPEELARLNELASEMTRDLAHPLAARHALGPQCGLADQPKLSDLVGESLGRLTAPGRNSQQPASTAASAGAPALTYELHYRPEQAHVLRMATLVDLERSLATLEARVGSGHIMLPGASDMKTAIKHLQQKLMMMDPDSLQNLSRRLQSVVQQLDLNPGGPDGGAASAKQAAAVSALLTVVAKCDATAQQVPDLVARLQTLRGVHDQAISLFASVARIESAQATAAGTLAHQARLLAQMEGSVAKNTEIMSRNASLLQQRVAKLREKLALLR